MRNRQLLINSIYYTIGEVLPRIISFFLLPVLTRCLTPAEYGINSYTNTVMLFSAALASLSLNTFLLRNYYKEETPESKKQLIGNIALLMMSTNGVITVLELLLFPWLLKSFHVDIPFHPYFLLAILNSFLDSLSIVPLAVYRIRQNAKRYVLVNATKTFFQFVVTLVLLMKFHYGLTGVYLARLYVNIPYSILFLLVVYRSASFRPYWAQMKKAFSFSLPLLPGLLSYLFIQTFDRIVLEPVIGQTGLGLYSSAATMALALNIVIQGLYRAFEQRIFEKHGSAEYGRMTDTLYRYFLVCVLTGGFGLSIFSREVFLLFTSRQFLAAYKLVPLLVVPVILSGLTTFLATLVLAEHRQVVITKATMVSAAFTVAGTLILIKVIGVYGAILTSAAAFAIVIWFYLRAVPLEKSYMGKLVGLVAVLLALSVGAMYAELAPVWSIPLKALVSLGYFGLCVRLFRVQLHRLVL